MYYIEARQASVVYKYKNVKIKMLKVPQYFKFNKMCIKMTIIPKYARININSRTPAALKTKQITEKTWLTQEIRQLYKKKNRLNTDLDKAHLEMLKEIHPAVIDIIMTKINALISNYFYHKVLTHKKKILNLYRIQHKKENRPIECKHVFYERCLLYTSRCV